MLSLRTGSMYVMTLLVGAILLLMAKDAMSAEGGEGGFGPGNGGDAYALEFVSIGRALGEHWNELSLPESVRVLGSWFRGAVERTRVVTVDRTFLKTLEGQREVDAVNYPDAAVIELSRTRWEATLMDRERKAALVLHEYLGILGIADDGYQVSGPALATLPSSVWDPNRDPIHFACRVEEFGKPGGKRLILSYDTYNLFDAAGKEHYLASKWEINDPLWDYGIQLHSQSFFLSKSSMGADANGRLYFRFFHGRNPAQRQVLRDWAEVDFGRSGRAIVKISYEPNLVLTCFRVLEQ